MTTSVTRTRKVFIVEDAASLRARLVELIEGVPATRIVGEAATPGDAIEGILRTQPDCVILDLHLRGGSGLEVLRQMRARHCESVIIVLTNRPEPAYRAACLASGAKWFFDKSKEFEKVPEVVAGIVPRSDPDGG
jgi:DNA-binding NarL/FixJ family response regulator